MAAGAKPEVRIDRPRTSAYTIPTDLPESDGTYAWDETTLVLVEAEGGGHTGLGYTYSNSSAAHLIDRKLAEHVKGRDAFDVQAAWAELIHEVRNIGRPGICSAAIAAIDIALWDLKARLLGIPLVSLFGAAHDEVPAYGSGGFTSYSIEQLQKQLDGWAEQGFQSVKMKVGTHPEQDIARVRAAREAIGDRVDLFVDGNGAYNRKQALEKASGFAGLNVTWFEEPVSSDDLDGLRLIRDRAPAGMDIAAGEYGWDVRYFRRMVGAGAVDVLQADCTRCAGFTEWLRAAAVAAAHSVRYSAHTAPSLHTHVSCAVSPMYNIEYFHDHVGIEHMLFDGALTATGGVLRPDLSRAGMGLKLKRQDAEKYKVYQSS